MIPLAMVGAFPALLPLGFGGDGIGPVKGVTWIDPDYKAALLKAYIDAQERRAAPTPGEPNG